MTDKNFIIKNGLSVGTAAVLDSSGDLTAAAFGTAALEVIDDQVNTLLTAGTGVSLSYDDAAGTLTINGQQGDVTGVTAGDGLSGGGNSGAVTVALDLNELTAAAVDVANDSVAIVDASASNGSRKESIADLATAMAGTNITATNGVLSTTADLTGVTAGDGLSGGGTSGAITVALDFNELTAAAVDVANDSIPIIDATGNTSNKESIADLATAMAGTNITATNGVLSSTADLTGVTAGDGLSGGGTSGAITVALDLNELTAATVDVANDSVAIIDANDSNGSRKEAIADISTAIAGTGITASSGVLAIGQAVATSDKPSFAGVTTTAASTIGGHLIPTTDDTYDLGSSTKTWKDVYIGPGSLYVNGQKVVEDSSGTIVISADSNQNVSVQTGGSGDVELDPTGSGSIQLKGPVEVQAGSNITSSDGNAITFANSIDVDAIESRTTNGNLTISANGTGVVAISDSMTISGDLTVSGTTTTVNSETINLADNIIALNSNFTSGTPSEDSGISITRGSSSAKTLIWDESEDEWSIGSEHFKAGTLEGNLTGNVTGNVSGSAGTVTALTGHDTDDLTEGSSNLYHTTARARAAISVTDAGGDGSAAYNSSTGVITYTGPSAAEVRAHITAGTGVAISNGAVSIGQAVGTSSNVGFGQITTSHAANSGAVARNIHQSTSAPGGGDGAIGDLWILYS